MYPQRRFDPHIIGGNVGIDYLSESEIRIVNRAKGVKCQGELGERLCN